MDSGGRQRTGLHRYPLLIATLIAGGIFASTCTSSQVVAPRSVPGAAPSPLPRAKVEGRVRPAVDDLVASRVAVVGGAGPIAAAPRRTWVGAGASVVRVNAQGTRGSSISTPAEVMSLTMTLRGPVAALADGTVVLIDGGTERLVELADLGSPPRAIVGSGNHVWASVDAPHWSVLRFDVRTGGFRQVGRMVAHVLMVDPEGDVWAWNGRRRLVTPITHRVAHRVGTPLPDAVGYPVVTAGLIWTSGMDTVVGIDPASGDARISVEVPRAAALAASRDGVWVLSATGSRSDQLYLPDPQEPAMVTLIDPRSGRVLGRTEVDRSPARIIAGPEGAWTSHHDTGALIRVSLGST